MLLHICFAQRFCERGGLQTMDRFYRGIDGLPLCLCAFLCFHVQEILIIGAQNNE